MAVIPGYYLVIEPNGPFTQRQLVIIASVQYLSGLVALIVIAGMIYNIWNFIIRQKRYKTRLLLAFYVLAVPLAIDRFIYVIWYLPFVY